MKPAPAPTHLRALAILCLLATGLQFTARAADPKPAPNAPNAGWKQWTGKYKLQNWTTRPDSEQFHDNGKGEYDFKLAKADARPAGTSGGNRVELAWPRWPDQKSENMICADVMYEKGTRGTCIMQIKTNKNTGGSGNEAIYLNIRDDNCLHHGVSKTVIIDDKGFDVWHNIKAAYNPLTGRARVWVDDVLKFEQTYRNGGIDSDWYFKTGAYWASGTSKVHFKNITFWTNPVKPTKEELKAAKAEADRKAMEAELKKSSSTKPKKK